MSGRNQLCVYTHSANGKVFYVGQGTLCRPTNHTARSCAWRAQAARGYEINIVHRTDDRREAVRVESELIAAHRPVCNFVEYDRKTYSERPPNTSVIHVARAMLGLTQEELGGLAGLSKTAITNIERGVVLDPKSSTLRNIQRALERAGAEFIGDNGVVLK
jgi:DNA-binding XRE family transcriptional regulator